MSTIDTARMLAETDPRVGGIVGVCDCGELVISLDGRGAPDSVLLRRDLVTGYPHFCPTTTSVYRLTVTHSADKTPDTVAKLVAKIIDGYGHGDIDSADVTCCVCGETGGGCCEFGADPDRLKAMKS